jgi:hypothetical protein
MRWAAVRNAGQAGTLTHQHIKFHDLLDDDGTLLGYVREDIRCGGRFMAITNNLYAVDSWPVVSTLEEAKAQLIHHFVLQRLEDI